MTLDHLKASKRQIIERHVRPNDRKGLTMVLTTLLPVACLFYATLEAAEVSYWLSAAMLLATSLFLIRAFVLMHECGHGSLFRSGRLNRAFGFVLGVFTGMPQYVWARHHQHHHATNGNWERYRGPLNVIRVHEYEVLTPGQKRRYRGARSIWMAPLAGLMYVIVNPRLNWLKGSFGWLLHVAMGKVRQPRRELKALASEFISPHWASAKEYQHMCLNSCMLLGLWVAISWLDGSGLFVACPHHQCLARRRSGHRHLRGAAQLRPRLCQRRRRLGLRPRGARGHQLPDAASLAELVHGLARPKRLHSATKPTSRIAFAG